MTEFDDVLRVRFEHLDAAIPVPAPMPLPAVAPRRSKRRRWQAVLLAAAVVAAFVITAIGVVATQPPPDPAVVARDQADEQRLRDDLGAAMAGRCFSLGEAKALFRERLDALGLMDWTIRDDGRTAKSPCVGGAAIGDAHEILVTPSLGGPLAADLDRLERRLIDECLTRDEAVAALHVVLDAHGIANPQIELSGVQIVPVEGTDAYLKHVDAGCYVYGHAQFDQQGRYTWYISGR